MSKAAIQISTETNARGWRKVRDVSTLVVAAIALICILPAHAADSAKVTFTLDFPGSDPEHYSISVSADGHASYECVARISADSEDRDNYQSEFVFSDIARARIFDLAAQAHYFSGKIDSGNRKLASTGNKKLSYTDGQRTSAAEYNFSHLVPVQQLTTIFQNTATTLEFGRRLQYDHHYQKLALDEELKKMEDLAHRGELAEIQAVKPILLQIYQDNSVLNVVRARAERIMEMNKMTTAGQ
ncbi:MAG TPA: hypothetical protein VMR80_02145 [Candidatus Acidoferrum sp.]|jgi:hypothetical protein|nr:hypothetical protein [Candidatus Acidoferrum sp.]